MKKTTLIVILVMLSLISIAAATYEHEQIHKVITEEYGCNNTLVKYEIFSGSVQCNDDNYTWSADEIKLHATNEVVGYNINIGILILTITGFFTIMMRKDEN